MLSGSISIVAPCGLRFPTNSPPGGAAFPLATGGTIFPGGPKNGFRIDKGADPAPLHRRTPFGQAEGGEPNQKQPKGPSSAQGQTLHLLPVRRLGHPTPMSPR